jgi:hypothetical protein
MKQFRVLLTACTVCCVLALLKPAPCLADDLTRPGEVSTPFPTITNLAVEWQIDGDDDLDAICDMEFRVKGKREWRPGMPLRRVPTGSSQKTSPIVNWTNRFSGSVFDLEPDTDYEIQLTLHDPDGGDATRIVAVRIATSMMVSRSSHPGSRRTSA